MIEIIHHIVWLPNGVIFQTFRNETLMPSTLRTLSPVPMLTPPYFFSLMERLGLCGFPRTTLQELYMLPSLTSSESKP